MSKARTPRTSNLIILHLTVFVWGFTGILGKLISVSSTHLVWYRVLIAFVSLYIYFKGTKTNLRITRQVFLKLFFTGAIVGLHWILFFESIKAATVSVGLVCLSSLTLFTAILEPLIKKHTISRLDIFTGILIICGIYIIFKFETQYTYGIICGLLSALCASVFTIINSKQIKSRSASVITFYELVGAWVWISVFLFMTGDFNVQMSLTLSDMICLFLLGTVCTSVAYVAGILVMKELSAFKVALITNLEPIYGIILAFIFFGKKEEMTAGFYIGTVIILASIFLHPVVKNMMRKRSFRKQIPLG